MKRLFLAFLFTGLALLYFGCSEKNPSAPELSQSDQVTNTLAKKPLPNLTGTFAIVFTNTPPYFWNGTLTIDGVTYGLTYRSLGTTPPPPPPRAFVFDERIEIWDEGFTTLYLEGPNRGVVPCGNNSFVANGKAEFVDGPFEEWLGRNVHTNGIITWAIPCVVPIGATGTFRIN